MPTMRVPVIVLDNSQNCFQEEKASGLDPIFYESLRLGSTKQSGMS